MPPIPALSRKFLSWWSNRRSCADHGDAAIRAIGSHLAAVALGHNLWVASGVGFIALAGVSAEFGVIMLLYSTNPCT